jgi:hypothetical protein
MKKSVTEDELGFLTRTRLCRVPAETVHPRWQFFSILTDCLVKDTFSRIPFIVHNSVYIKLSNFSILCKCVINLIF